MDIRELQRLDQLARDGVQKYPMKRRAFQALQQDAGRHFVGIVGPRGVGKTIILKQLAAATPNSFYLAADTLGDEDLFDAARVLVQDYGIRTLLIDEVHFKRDYDEALKKLFDFLDIRVVFTSSVSLSIFESAYDLSRRVRLLTLYPFSFREYVYFMTRDALPQLTLEQIRDKSFDRAVMRYEHMFGDYLRGGVMPFSLEEPDAVAMLRNIVQTIVARDIPSVARLSTDELPAIEKVIAFTAKSSIDGVNFSSLSRNVGITKYKSEQYVELLRRAFVLNPVFPAGTNVTREPKVLMCLPYRLLHSDYETAIGGLREDFFAESIRMAGLSCSYLKSTRGSKTPDFLVGRGEQELIVEVGGKGRGREQFKGIAAKKSLVFSHAGEMRGLRRPLFLAGFLG
jgi:predicted AAA+ superfamily ATPase